MRLPVFLYLLRLRDVVGIAIVFVVLTLVLFVSVKFPTGFAKHVIGWTLGPGWTCQYVGKGEPVCIKDVLKAPTN